MSDFPHDTLVDLSSSGGSPRIRRFTSQRQWSVDVSVLARVIMGEIGTDSLHPALEEVDSSHVETEGFSHWQHRKWLTADRHYLSACATQYADDDDQDGNVRKTVLADYVARNGLPEDVAYPSRRGWSKPLERGTGSIPLPELTKLLQSRRSGRSFKRQPLTVSTLKTVLRDGFSEIRGNRRRLSRDNPVSWVAGRIGCVWDPYVVVYEGSEIRPGIYFYDIYSDELQLHKEIKESELCRNMQDVLQGQRPSLSAGFTVVFVARFQRYQWRYRHEGGLRALYMDAGLVSQWLLLRAWRHGLACLVTPAQRDSLLSEMLGLDPVDSAPVTTLTFGWSRGFKGSFLEE